MKKKVKQYEETSYKNLIKKRKLKKVKLDKTTKGVIIGAIIFAVVSLIFRVLSYIFPSVGTFFWVYIRNPIMGVLFKLFQNDPNMGADLTFVFIICMALFIVLVWIGDLTRLCKYETRVKLVNFGTCGTIIMMVLSLFPMLLSDAYINNEKLNQLYDNEVVVNKEYTKDDLVRLNEYLVNEIVEMSSVLEREDGKVIYTDKLSDIAIYELKNSSNKYKFLKGLYPSTVGDFSKEEKTSNFDVTLGYTGYAGVVINSDAGDVEEINTIMHEMCHVKGVNRESEAEYCAFLASVDSKSPEVVYSAYVSAYTRTLSALNYVDAKEAYRVEEDFLNLCSVNNYDEACNFYTKNINDYFDGADEFIFRGYKLKYYKDYKEELKSLLNILSKYDLVLKVDGEEVSVEDVLSLVDKQSDEILVGKIKINKKKWKNVVSSLQENSKLIVLGYQNDSSIEEDMDMPEGEEALSYYLKPFNKTDYFTGDEYNKEYYYERATRHFLEYFDGRY